MTKFAQSLYHPDPDAPAGYGRALQKGDVIARFNPRSPGVPDVPADPRRWVLLADPKLDSQGWYEPQDVPAMYFETEDTAPTHVRLGLTGFDVVGLGLMRTASAPGTTLTVSAMAAHLGGPL